MKIPSPSTEQVKCYLQKWANNDEYVLKDRILKKLFTETYPNNNELSDVLRKVSLLNDFYGTRIRSSFVMAKHIVSRNIDNRLKKKEFCLVDDIANVQATSPGHNRCYTFATKYCSFHKPEDFPIHDSRINNMLWKFKKKDDFAKFLRKDLYLYTKFRDTVLQFREHYRLEKFTLKELDQYLWQLAEEYPI